MSKRNRSAKTGRFVSSSYTKKHPTTTLDGCALPGLHSQPLMGDRNPEAVQTKVR
jgi:hypothetical protein